MQAGVDGRVDAWGMQVLPDHRQPGMEVGQTPRRQGGTARHKLDEGLWEGGREGGRGNP